jgi:hypothetical protein
MKIFKSAAKLLCGALVIVSLSITGALASGMKEKLHGPMVILIDKNGVVSIKKVTTKTVSMIEMLLKRYEEKQLSGNRGAAY